MNTNIFRNVYNNKFRKLFVVAFAVILMLTASIASASISTGGYMVFLAGWNTSTGLDTLRVVGSISVPCDPANCYSASADIQMQVYENGEFLGQLYDYASGPGWDNSYSASIQYDIINPNLSSNYTARLDYMGYSSDYGNYYSFETLSYP